MTGESEENMMQRVVRYDELKVGDIINFHGALERVVKVEKKGSDIFFTIEPFEDESIRILGKFYSNGTYGGTGSMSIVKVS